MGIDFLDKIPISHHSYILLTYMLLLPDCRDGWCQEMFMEYGPDYIPIVRVWKQNEIEAAARSCTQPVSFKHEGQPLQITKAWRNEEEEEEEKSKDKGKPRQSGRRQERLQVKATPMAYYLFHIFDRWNAFSPVLWAQHLFKQLLVDTYCKIEVEGLSYLNWNQNGLRAADYTSLV